MFTKSFTCYNSSSILLSVDFQAFSIFHRVSNKKFHSLLLLEVVIETFFGTLCIARKRSMGEFSIQFNPFNFNIPFLFFCNCYVFLLVYISIHLVSIWLQPFHFLVHPFQYISVYIYQSIPEMLSDQWVQKYKSSF